MEDDAEEQRNAKSNQGEERGICSAWYKTIWNTPEEGEAVWAQQNICFGNCKRISRLFRGITSKVKKDNEKYFKCT